MDVDGLLLDIDGVLAVSWEPIAGAIDAPSWLRAQAIPFKLGGVRSIQSTEFLFDREQW
jgi:ribonucleotide monophosphatase NagD (HAD superfamily)